jgi:hypothetical protein
MFFRKFESITVLLVSWRQKATQQLSSIVFLMALHLQLSFIPLSFQERIF